MSTRAVEVGVDSQVPNDHSNLEKTTLVEIGDEDIVRDNRYIVSFEGPDDPQNPLNWSPARKWFLVGMISVMTLLVSLATLMCAPAAPLILHDLGSDSALYRTLIVSIWELGEAIGPLLSAPLSEMYGRAPVYHTAIILFFVFSVAGAVSTNVPMFLAFRFLNGATVVSVVLNPSIIGDLFVTEERGGAIAILGLFPLLGPIAGPIIGGYISQAIGWRWLFWLTAILAAVIEIGLLLFFRETYKVRILEKKAERLRKKTGNKAWTTTYKVDTSVKKLLTGSIIRPMRMIVFSPIIFLMAFYVAIVYGYIFILFTTLAEVFQDKYGFSTGSASLTFLGLGIGFVVGTFTCRLTLDRWVKRMKDRGEMKPEQRLPPMLVAGIVIPVALFWYGWSVQAHVQWSSPVIATGVLGFGLVTTILPSTSYLIDAFGVHAASAMAGNMAIRCVTSALFPLVAPPLYSNLGVGWGTSVLGFVAVAFVPVPLLLMRYGERIRRNSKFLVLY